MKFAKYVFSIAGIYGLVALVPQYFLEEKTGRDFPPAITHPEFFYGFIGVALAWQVVFLIIGRDPARYRLLMLPAVIEKFSFGISTAVLYFTGRTNVNIFAASVIDVVLGILFLTSFFLTTSDTGSGTGESRSSSAML